MSWWNKLTAWWKEIRKQDRLYNSCDYDWELDLEETSLYEPAFTCTKCGAFNRPTNR